MLPFARPNSLRIVLVNRRDYPHSTPLSCAELALIGPDASLEDRAAFFRARGVELANFLAWFACAQDIHPTEEVDGRTSGGMAIAAWSSANNVAMALFGNLDTLPKETLHAIRPYLRTYIHYGATFRTVCIRLARSRAPRIDGPRWAAGYPPVVIEGFHEPKPLANAALTEDERLEQFKVRPSAIRALPGPNLAHVTSPGSPRTTIIQTSRPARSVGSRTLSRRIPRRRMTA
jgi:hypothetical protein